MSLIGWSSSDKTHQDSVSQVLEEGDGAEDHPSRKGVIETVICLSHMSNSAFSLVSEPVIQPIPIRHWHL